MNTDPGEKLTRLSKFEKHWPEVNSPGCEELAESSRESAGCESPARKCRERLKIP
jgi:hypothetical protein